MHIIGGSFYHKIDINFQNRQWFTTIEIDFSRIPPKILESESSPQSSENEEKISLPPQRRTIEQCRSLQNFENFRQNDTQVKSIDFTSRVCIEKGQALFFCFLVGGWRWWWKRRARARHTSPGCGSGLFSIIVLPSENTKKVRVDDVATRALRKESF